MISSDKSKIQRVDDASRQALGDDQWRNSNLKQLAVLAEHEIEAQEMNALPGRRKAFEELPNSNNSI